MDGVEAGTGGDRAMMLAVVRDQRYQRYSPLTLTLTRMPSDGAERFEMRLQSPVHRELSQKIGAMPNGELGVVGRELALEVIEHATIELNGRQIAKLRDDISRHLGEGEGNEDTARDRMSRLLAQFVALESLISQANRRMPEAPVATADNRDSAGARAQAEALAAATARIEALVARLERSPPPTAPTPAPTSAPAPAPTSASVPAPVARGGRSRLAPGVAIVGLAFVAAVAGSLVGSGALGPRAVTEPARDTVPPRLAAAPTVTPAPSPVASTPIVSSPVAPSMVASSTVAPSMGEPSPVLSNPILAAPVAANPPPQAAAAPSSANSGAAHGETVQLAVPPPVPLPGTGPAPDLAAAMATMPAQPPAPPAPEPGPIADPAPSRPTRPVPAQKPSPPSGETPGSRNASFAAPASHEAVLARADAWIRVRDAYGNTYIERTLKAGETWTVPPVPGLLLTTGNAGGTSLVFDGVAGPPLGADGAVRAAIPLAPTRR